MGRLTALPSRMTGLPSRVVAAPKVAEGFYQSPEWRAYRDEHKARTIAEQGGLWCCQCGSTHRLILDHDVERRDGGPDFPPFEDAKWYCAAHHNAKTAKAKAARALGRGGVKSPGA